MRKKHIFIALCVLVVLTLIACGKIIINRDDSKKSADVVKIDPNALNNVKEEFENQKKVSDGISSTKNGIPQSNSYQNTPPIKSTTDVQNSDIIGAMYVEAGVYNKYIDFFKILKKETQKEKLDIIISEESDTIIKKMLTNQADYAVVSVETAVKLNNISGNNKFKILSVENLNKSEALIEVLNLYYEIQNDVDLKLKSDKNTKDVVKTNSISKTLNSQENIIEKQERFEKLKSHLKKSDLEVYCIVLNRDYYNYNTDSVENFWRKFETAQFEYILDMQTNELKFVRVNNFTNYLINYFEIFYSDKLNDIGGKLPDKAIFE